MDYGTVVKAILFALFGALTAAVTVVTGPTYDLLFVPEMAPSSAFAPWQGGNVFALAAAFSNTLLVELVDPAAVLVIAAVGMLYLLRATHPTPRLAGLGPKLVLGVLVANLALPLAGAFWQLAGGLYPIFYGYGGGAWQVYNNLVGPGGVQISWDNGLLSFIVSWVLFGLVLLLAFLVAFRSALVGVLLVLLPPLTLLWPIPGAATLAKRVWALFLEMTFLPCFLVVPLVLAVGSTNVLLTLGLFSVALAMPQILSASGAAISHAGFPNTSFVVAGGLTQGAGAAREQGAGLLRKGGSSWRTGFHQGRSSAGGSGPSSHASGGHAPVSPGMSGRASRSGAGGAAGPVLWGLGEGLGSLARVLGERTGRAFPAAAPTRTSGALTNPTGGVHHAHHQPHEQRWEGDAIPPPLPPRESVHHAARSRSTGPSEMGGASRAASGPGMRPQGGAPSRAAAVAPPRPPAANRKHGAVTA